MTYEVLTRIISISPKTANKVTAEFIALAMQFISHKFLIPCLAAGIGSAALTQQHSCLTSFHHTMFRPVFLSRSHRVCKTSSRFA